MGGEAAVVGRGDDGLGARDVVVRERAVVEELTATRDPGERRADTAGADDEDPHCGQDTVVAGVDPRGGAR